MSASNYVERVSVILKVNTVDMDLSQIRHGFQKQDHQMFLENFIALDQVMRL